MNTVSVRLQTLCGCTKFMLVNGPAPQTIELPIAEVSNAEGAVALRMRTFKLQRMQPPNIAVEADYHEVPATQ